MMRIVNFLKSIKQFNYNKIFYYNESIFQMNNKKLKL